ncbi:MAG: adenine-specific methyltransferase EcoRI family protein, partial [Flavobacteriaceae bacterium]
MPTQASNRNLHRAKNAKKDEFYTQLADIENELRHYRAHFRDKVVYCNCDDPRVSNFFHYFSYNFEDLGLKKLITTCYQNQNLDLFSQHNCARAIYLEYYGDTNQNKIPDCNEIEVQYLKGDGDFRSEESIALLQQADIVVTNPPFSLFREY